ncbi:hypothetical protein ABZ814_20005 [Micromonospora musae]
MPLAGVGEVAAVVLGAPADQVVAVVAASCDHGVDGVDDHVNP